LVRQGGGVEQLLRPAAPKETGQRPGHALKLRKNSLLVEPVGKGGNSWAPKAGPGTRRPEVACCVVEVRMEMAIIRLDVFGTGPDAEKLKEGVVTRKVTEGCDPEAGEGHVGPVHVHGQDALGGPCEVVQYITPRRRDGENSARFVELEGLGVDARVLPNLRVYEPPEPRSEEAFTQSLKGQGLVVLHGAAEAGGSRA